MRVAVTYEAGSVFQHFGRTEQFKIYDVVDGEIKSSTVIGTDGKGHGMLADVLAKENVDALICGGIGEGAKNRLAAAGIQLYGGVSGDVDEAVTALIMGNLPYNPHIECAHHGEQEHGDGHGGHQCGEHSRA